MSISPSREKVNVSVSWVFSQMGCGMLHCVVASFVVDGSLIKSADISAWRIS